MKGGLLVFVIDSMSEIREKIDSETMSKYAICVMLEFEGKLEPGLLCRNGQYIGFSGIYLYPTNQRYWHWPPHNNFTVDKIHELMGIIYAFHTIDRWSSKFYILQNPDDVAWFINEFRIPPGNFATMVKSRFITERNTIPRKL